MTTGDFYFSFMVSLILHLTLLTPIQTTTYSPDLSTVTTNNTNKSANDTRTDSSNKNPLDQGKEILHDAFSKMDRGTLIRATIVLGGITCLVLMYIGIKRLIFRKKSQPKRYTLITDPNAMEEPLFGANDDEEEIEDDTLFVRK